MIRNEVTKIQTIREAGSRPWHGGELGLRQAERDRWNGMALAVEARKREEAAAELARDVVTLELSEDEASTLTYALFLLNRRGVDHNGISDADIIDLWTGLQAMVFPQTKAIRERRAARLAVQS
jgi:hypothetical protein